jgi:hypothetical protein
MENVGEILIGGLSPAMILRELVFESCNGA